MLIFYKPACLQQYFQGRLLSIRVFSSGGHYGPNLECKDHVKYLGVLIDYKLSWKNHIDSITMRLSRTIGLVSKIRHFVPFHTLVSIYNCLVDNCLVVPYLRYSLIAWGQAGKTQLNKLLILQKRALRLMCFADRCDNTIPLFFRVKTVFIIMNIRFC